MRNGRFGRLIQVGVLGIAAVFLAISGCGRERVNPIDPNFAGSESLSPPGNIRAEGDIGRITLQWAPVSSSTLAGYGVWRSTTATEGYVRLRGEAADTSITTARNTFVDTTLNLAIAKVYFYRINTVDTEGHASELSVFVSGEALDDNRPPNSPTDLSAVTDVNTGQVTLSWIPPLVDAGNALLTGLDQYKVFRSKDTQDAFVLVATVPAGQTTFQDPEELEVDARYFYKVSAIDPAGNESARSVAATLTTAGTGVVAPTGLSATGSIGEIAVRWNAVGEPALLGYLVLRSESTQGPFEPVTSDTVFTTGQTQYLDQNVTADQVYYYRVQTVVQDPTRGTVRSIESPFVDGTASADQSAPAAPSDLIVSLDDNNFRQVQASWTAPITDSNGGDLTGLASFQVFRSRETNTSFALLATIPGTQVAYQDTSVELLTRYFYAVSAVDSVGNVGPRSTAVSVTTKGFAVPRNLLATPGGEKVTLDWTANTEPELTGYEILRFTNAADETPESVFSSVLTTYVDSPVAAGQTVVYRVRAVGQGDIKSELSSFVSAQALGILATPRSVQAAGGIGRITLSWAANTEPELTGYEILRYTDPAQSNPQATFSTVQTTYVDSPLAQGQTFVYRVRAVGSGNLQSDLSLFASATAQIDNSAPATPGNLGAVLLGSTTIELRWTAPRTDSGGGDLTGLSGYVIYRAAETSSAGFTEFDRIDSTRVSYQNSQLDLDKTYFYRISAVDALGNESALSNSVSLRTPASVGDDSAPGTPTNLAAVLKGGTTIELQWNAPRTDANGGDLTGLSGFVIYRATGSAAAGFTVLTQVDSTKRTYQNSGLDFSTTYLYRVSSVDASGNESSLTSSVSLTTDTEAASIAAPTNLTAVYNGSLVPAAVQLSWTPPVEWDSFLIQRAEVVAGSLTQTFTTLETAHATTSYNDSTIESGKTYIYRISTNRSGLISDPSRIAVVVIP